MARRKTYQKGNVQWHNNQWTVRYREWQPGQNKWVTKREQLPGCFDRRNKKAALSAAEPIMARVNEQNNNPQQVKSVVTFGSFVAGLWRDYMITQGLQASTIYGYGIITEKYLLPAFQDKPIDSLTPADMTAFFNSLPRTLTPVYVRSIYSILNTMFMVAEQYDLIQVKPLRTKLHNPKGKPDKKPTLSIDVVKQVIEKVDANYRLFFLIIAVGGLRVGETIALRWADFDPARSTLSITHSMWRRKLKPPKNRSSVRTSYLPPPLVAMLEQRKRAATFSAPTDLIFCRPDGSAEDQNWIRANVLYKALDELGIKRSKSKYGFHILRHTAASVLHAKTGDMKLVQETLGHSTLSTTADIYTHLSPEVAKRATEILASEFLSNLDPTATCESKMVS